MENKTFKFKTNINCGGCVSTVTPFLNGIEGISEWEVDVNDKDKPLTVVSDTATEHQIVDAVREAGYKIEKI